MYAFWAECAPRYTRLYRKRTWNLYSPENSQPRARQFSLGHFRGLQCDVDDPGRRVIKKPFLNKRLDKRKVEEGIWSVMVGGEESRNVVGSRRRWKTGSEAQWSIFHEARMRSHILDIPLQWKLCLYPIAGIVGWRGISFVAALYETEGGWRRSEGDETGGEKLYLALIYILWVLSFSVGGKWNDGELPAFCWNA